MATCMSTGGGAFPAEQVGTSEARRTGFVGGDTPPEGVDPSTVVDEVTLAHVDPQSACFDAVVRAAPRVDVPVSELSATCRVGEAAVPATTSNEMVSVYDYDREGNLDDVVTEDVTAEGYQNATLRAPRPRIFRVVERSGRLCCAIDTSGPLTLGLTGRDGDPVLFRWAAP